MCADLEQTAGDARHLSHIGGHFQLLKLQMSVSECMLSSSCQITAALATL